MANRDYIPTPQMLDNVMELYSQGLSVNEVSRRVGLKDGWIKKILLSQGIQIRSQKETFAMIPKKGRKRTVIV
jgi:hypothetical protein